ncbi:MAG TPA: NAD(P)-binding protein, partial [Thiobacillus sp.]|nr:NAD(P)-binding protein [Thiobacillus sp.]
MARLRAGIVGAGIAGANCAGTLAAAGWDVDIFEKAH